MAACFTTVVALSMLGAPLSLSHEAQLCALVQQCDGMHHEAPCDPMRVTPDMAAFVARHVNRNVSHRDRLRQLVWAVGASDELGFRYDPDATQTAGEAFRARFGDCVSFSLMFVSMARLAGLDARFQSVSIKTGKRRSRGLTVSCRHLNVVVFLPRAQVEVDITLPNLWTTRKRGFCRGVVKELVPDRFAWSAYFNNKAVESLAEDDLVMAEYCCRAAVVLAPECADAWVNFGVCRRVLGDLDRAEGAYLRALTCQSDCRAARANLILLRRIKEAAATCQSRSGQSTEIDDGGAFR